MDDKQNSEFNFAKGSTSILKGVNPDDIGSTGVLFNSHTGATGTLDGSISPNVYNTEYNYEKANPTKTNSKTGKVLLVVLIAVFIVIAIVAALMYFKK